MPCFNSQSFLIPTCMSGAIRHLQRSQQESGRAATRVSFLRSSHIFRGVPKGSCPMLCASATPGQCQLSLVSMTQAKVTSQLCQQDHPQVRPHTCQQTGASTEPHKGPLASSAGPTLVETNFCPISALCREARGQPLLAAWPPAPTPTAQPPP